MENIKITNNEEYENALKLKKEIRDKIYNLRLKIAIEPMNEYNKETIKKEALLSKKQLGRIMAQIAMYELNENEKKKEGKKI